MRLSPDYYPEYVDVYCYTCDLDSENLPVDSIEGEDVCVTCPECGEVSYVRVID